jgi:Adenylate and Guanylate cyclase catalytic domain
VTFLFSDLVDSTLLWEQRERDMAGAVARHDLILGEVVSRNAGAVVKFQGDGLMAVFDDADAAVRAAVDGQRALGAEDWSVPLGVRMGLCTGTARASKGDYHGQVVNRAARTASAAHPGQIVVTPSTAALVDGFDLRDLGEYHLKGLAPMRLSQVFADGIESHFPPLSVPPAGLDVSPATTFVGRARELESVQRLVSDQPIVTLTGAGGCGKTRLAVEIARQLSPRFRSGRHHGPRRRRRRGCAGAGLGG